MCVAKTHPKAAKGTSPAIQFQHDSILDQQVQSKNIKQKYKTSLGPNGHSAITFQILYLLSVPLNLRQSYNVILNAQLPRKLCS